MSGNRYRPAMRRALKPSIAPMIGVLLCSTGLVAGAAEKVAYVKDSEIFIVDENRQEGRQLTNNGVPKWLVRWSPSGQFLAYVEMTEPSVAKGRVVVVSPSGEVRTNVMIHEVKGQQTTGFRWIEDIIWFTDNSVGAYGSFNPTHCELIILNASTGAVLQDVALECGSFAVSPDGEHVVYLQTVESGPGNRSQDFVLMDRELSLLPPGGEGPITVTGSPKWSADSSRIAFVAKSAGDGSVSVITADKTGMVSKQDISPSFGVGAELAWSGDALVVRSDSLTIAVDPVSRSWRVASADEEAIVEGVSQRKAHDKRVTSRRADLEAQRGWRSADVWTDDNLGQ